MQQEKKRGKEMDRRLQNVLIFEDTDKLCHINEELKKAIQYSYENQKIYKEGDSIAKETEKKNTKRVTKILVSKKRSLEAASAYQGKKTCVHNFASATNPGGGVVRGSSAQEECLCRCSTLYFNLNIKTTWENFYIPHREMHNPIYNGDCIYTPNVVVFKTDTNLFAPLCLFAIEIKGFLNIMAKHVPWKESVIIKSAFL